MGVDDLSNGIGGQDGSLPGRAVNRARANPRGTVIIGASADVRGRLSGRRVSMGL